MRLRILIISAVVVVAASAATWWALKSRNGDEAPPASAVGPAATSANTAAASGARCRDRDGQLRAPLPDGTCPIVSTGSRLAPQDPEPAIDGSCEPDDQAALADSRDPVLAALSRGVCY
jgi:hypothetical protein